uniref:Natural resistance-associated macrophage protein n=1 Tax=Palpitomonas bilix TaxID=652834 RepID=A0A7S3G336_9EUKA
MSEKDALLSGAPRQVTTSYSGSSDGKSENDIDIEITASEAAEKQKDERLRRYASQSAIRKFFRYCGPGLLASMAFLDPGNLESDLQAGAYTGYGQMWTLLLATCVGLFFQIVSLRLGCVSGEGLATRCRREYGKEPSIVLWLINEVSVLASDMQEVIGTAIAINILSGLPLWAGILITGADTLTFLLLHKFGIRKVEFVFGVFIIAMVACFFVNYAEVQVNGTALGQGFVPNLPNYATLQAVGTFGAIVMPQNLFLHSHIVLSREIDRTSAAAIKEANHYLSLDITLSLAISFAINLAVVGAFAQSFFSSDCASHYLDLGQNSACLPSSAVSSFVLPQNVTCTADYLTPTLVEEGTSFVCAPISLETAGDALVPTLGRTGLIIWAVGLLASGQASTVSGTMVGQFIVEGFLKMKLSSWMRVLIVRIITIALCLALAFAYSVPGVSIDVVDEWLNVLQSLMLPFAVTPLVIFTSRRELMGRFKNHIVVTVLAWMLNAILLAMNLYLVITSFSYSSWTSCLAFTVGAAIYTLLVLLLFLPLLPLSVRNKFVRTPFSSSSSVASVAPSSPTYLLSKGGSINSPDMVERKVKAKRVGGEMKLETPK